MDLSSLPETQQEKLQELQEKFKEHQAQRQQEEQQQQQAHQNQQLASQAYDPSQQVQPYAHSQYDPNHAYYSYYQYQQQSHPQQQGQLHPQPQYQHYAYQQQPAQHDSGQVPQQSVTVAVSQEGASQMINGVTEKEQTQNQQIVHPPHDLGVQQQPQQNQQGTGADVAAAVAQVAAYPELNPAAAAAVAALSQLTQFAGTMDVAERAMAILQGHGLGEMLRPFMGQGQGQMHPQAGQPPFRGGWRRGGAPFRGSGRGGRGRGRGRGGGFRRIPPNTISSESPNPNPNNEESTGDGQDPVNPETNVAGTETEPVRQPGQPIRCELCQVDCNSLEIFENHKNGKRHMKNLQNPVIGPHQQPTPPPENTPATENLPTKAISRGGGTKRKSRGGGRGGKYARISEPPKVVIPIMCDLCNIKCDTREVFNVHLAGKKHLLKLKRFEGHQAMYGPMVHSLYPPNPIATQTMYHPHPPIQHQHQQQPYYGPQSYYPQPGPYTAPQPHLAEAAPMPANSYAAPAGMGTYPPNTSNV